MSLRVTYCFCVSAHELVPKRDAEIRHGNKQISPKCPPCARRISHKDAFLGSLVVSNQGLLVVSSGNVEESGSSKKASLCFL